MFIAIALLSVVTGGALAYAADRLPRHTKLLESAAGLLLIAGLALLGSNLASYVHCC